MSQIVCKYLLLFCLCVAVLLLAYCVGNLVREIRDVRLFRIYNFYKETNKMNYIDRMKVELKELKERIDKLDRYANKDTLMNLQLVKMIEYKLILEERIRKAEGE